MHTTILVAKFGKLRQRCSLSTDSREGKNACLVGGCRVNDVSCPNGLILSSKASQNLKVVIATKWSEKHSYSEERRYSSNESTITLMFVMMEKIRVLFLLQGKNSLSL